MRGKPNIIFSPHFDDAVLSLGGLVAAEAAQTRVITFFTGVPELSHQTRWDRCAGFKDSTEAMKYRAEENRIALTALGMAPSAIRNLSYLDRQYRPLAEDDRLKVVLPKVIASIAASLPDADLFAPAMEYHPDHALLKYSFLQVARPVEGRWHLYEDMTYSYYFLRLRSILPIRFFNFDLIRRFLAAKNSVAVLPIGISEREMDKKIQALDIYRSQFMRLHRILYRGLRQFAAAEARYYCLSSPYAETIYLLI